MRLTGPSRPYEPNWSNATVVRRLDIVVNWAAQQAEKEDAWIMSTMLDHIFGPTTHASSRYLREKLLICTNRHYKVGDYPRSYSINRDGLKMLTAKLTEQLRKI